MLLKNISYIDAARQLKTGSIVVSGNKIEAITDSADATGPDVYDGAGKLALPGFFNAHTHVPMVLLRGFGEGLDLHDWLNLSIFPFEAKMDADAIYWGSMLGIAEMIKSGSCSFTDMYMNICDIARAVDESGFKANLSYGCVTFDENASYADTNGYRNTVDLLKYIKTLKHDRIICDASMHAEYTSTERVTRECAEFAKEYNMRMHVHVSETHKEHEECKQRRGGRTPAKYFSDAGLFDVPTSAAHCVFAEQSDMEIFAEKGVLVAHCPSSNLKLGSGIAPVWQMISSGVSVGIGTDGAASNNNLNMLEEATLAALLQRGALRQPTVMDMPSVVKMASQNTALAQGRADCGAIAPGNRADIVVYDFKACHMHPVFDPLSNVLFSAQASDICLNMVDGKVLYKDGAFTTIDIDRVVYECDRIQKNILAQL